MKHTIRVLILPVVLVATGISVSLDPALSGPTGPALQAEGEAGGGLTKAQDLYRQGTDRMNSSRYLDAVEMFQLALDEDPEYLEAHRRLAFVYTQMGATDAEYYEDALEKFEDVKEMVADDDVGVRKSIAFVQAAMGDIDDAIDTYHEILTISPDDCAIWTQIGEAENVQANRLKAGSTETEENPAYTERLEKAVTAFNKVIELCPDSLQAYEALGEMYFHSDRRVEAAKIYGKMLEKNPNDLAVLRKVGHIHKKAEDWAKAEPIYAKILELDPSLVSARQSYAKALQKQGKHVKAASEFQKIIDADPAKFNKLYCNLAIMYAHDADDGEMAIATAMKGISENAPVKGCLTYAWAKGLELRAKELMRGGRYDRAISTYRESRLKFSSITTDANFGSNARKQLDRLDKLITIAEQTREKARQGR